MKYLESDFSLLGLKYVKELGCDLSQGAKISRGEVEFLGKIDGKTLENWREDVERCVR